MQLMAKVKENIGVRGVEKAQVMLFLNRQPLPSALT